MRPLHATLIRTRTRQAATFALAATLAGCGFFRADPPNSPTPPLAASATTKPVPEQSVETASGAVPGVLQPMNRPILQGPLPLVYLTENTATLRITNSDTGEEIVVLDVKPMQILRVETRGVVLGSDVVLGATLARGTYAVTPLADTAGVVRTQQVHIRPVMPTTKPAAEPTIATPPAPTADTPPPASN